MGRSANTDRGRAARRRDRRGSQPPGRPALALAVLPLLFLACAYAATPKESSTESVFSQAVEEYQNGHYYDAVLALTDFIRDHPGSVLVDQAIYYRGMCYVAQKDWVMAATDFERLVRDFPESRFACDAEFQLGETYWHQSRKPPYDQRETHQALEQFQRYQSHCPGHEGAEQAAARVAEARGRLAEKEYRTAVLYRRLRRPEAARIYLGLVIDEYGDTSWALRARQDRIDLDLSEGHLDEARVDLAWLEEHGAVDAALRQRFRQAADHGDAQSAERP